MAGGKQTAIQRTDTDTYTGSTRGGEKVDEEKTEYLTLESQIVPYMAFPRFLLDVKVNETARIVYVLLLDRARLSMKNGGWVDQDGHVYIIYPVSDLAKDLQKSEMTIKNCLASLEEAGLIHRSRGKPGCPSRTYVKVCVPTDSILSRRQTENYPSAGQDSFSQTDRKLSGNKNYTTKQYNQRYRNAYSNRPQVRRTYECREGESL